jgi:hypothetical protein
VSKVNTGWQTGEPVNLGAYVLLFKRPGRMVCSEIWDWTGNGWDDCGMFYDEDIDGKILGWMPLPEDLAYDN